MVFQKLLIKWNGSGLTSDNFGSTIMGYLIWLVNFPSYQAILISDFTIWSKPTIRLCTTISRKFWSQIKGKI